MTAYAGYTSLDELQKRCDLWRPLNAICVDSTERRDGLDVITTRIIVSQYCRRTDTVNYCQFVTAEYTLRAGAPVEPDVAERLERAQEAWGIVMHYLDWAARLTVPALLAAPKDLVLFDADGERILGQVRADLQHMSRWDPGPAPRLPKETCYSCGSMNTSCVKGGPSGAEHRCNDCGTIFGWRDDDEPPAEATRCLN